MKAASKCASCESRPIDRPRLRWTVPRFRYDQVMELGWKKLLPLSIANLLFYAILIAFLQKPVS